MNLNDLIVNKVIMDDSFQCISEGIIKASDEEIILITVRKPEKMSSATRHTLPNALHNYLDMFEFNHQFFIILKNIKGQSLKSYLKTTKPDYDQRIYLCYEMLKVIQKYDAFSNNIKYQLIDEAQWCIVDHVLVLRELLYLKEEGSFSLKNIFSYIGSLMDKILSTSNEVHRQFVDNLILNNNHYKDIHELTSNFKDIFIFEKKEAIEAIPFEYNISISASPDYEWEDPVVEVEVDARPVMPSESITKVNLEVNSEVSSEVNSEVSSEGNSETESKGESNMARHLDPESQTAVQETKGATGVDVAEPEIIEPVDVIKSTEAIESTEAIKPTETIEATEVIEPKEIIEPEEVIEPSQAIEPIEAIKPSEVIEPIEAIKPSEEVIEPKEMTGSNETVDQIEASKETPTTRVIEEDHSKKNTKKARRKRKIEARMHESKPEVLPDFCDLTPDEDPFVTPIPIPNEAQPLSRETQKPVPSKAKEDGPSPSEARKPRPRKENRPKAHTKKISEQTWIFPLVMTLLILVIVGFSVKTMFFKPDILEASFKIETLSDERVAFINTSSCSSKIISSEWSVYYNDELVQSFITDNLYPVFDTQGQYTISLRVKDQEGNWSDVYTNNYVYDTPQ